MKYEIVKKVACPGANESWTGDYWGDVTPLDINDFHSRGTSHKPVTQCKVAHTDSAIHLFFRVEDKFVRSIRTETHDSVCKDSCVEFFVQPPNPGGFYFNLEVNAGGTMLLFFVEDPSREGVGGLAKSTPVSLDWTDNIKIEHSLPDVVEPEIAEPTIWTIAYSIPVELFEAYLGENLGDLTGQTWRANFYKCGDETSQPHWASWAPVGEPLNFHKPEKFENIEFK